VKAPTTHARSGVVGEEVVAEVGADEEARLDGVRVDGPACGRVDSGLAELQEPREVVGGRGGRGRCHGCRPRRRGPGLPWRHFAWPGKSFVVDPMERVMGLQNLDGLIHLEKRYGPQHGL